MEACTLIADTLNTLRVGFRALWSDLFSTALCNLLWLVSMLLVIPGPPATAALFYYGNRKAHGEVTGVGDFFFALKKYWWVGWRWGLINLALIAILWGDYRLTGHLSQSNWAHFVQGFYLAVLAAWLLIQLYALPFLFEQKDPGVRDALRNSAVMLGRNIGFSVLLGCLLILILAAGIPLFMLSLASGGVFLAVVGNQAVIRHLVA
jgi:hypothetical protein